MNLEDNMDNLDQTNKVNVDEALATAIRTIGEVNRDRDELRLDLRYAISKIESLEEQLRTARNDLQAGRRG